MRIARGTCITAGLVLFAAFGGVAIAGDGDSPANASEAKVTRQQAEKVALAHVPGGAIKEAELEKENGRLVWSFDVALPNSQKVMDVVVDATTGEFVKEEPDN